MTSIFDSAHPHYSVHKAFVEGSFANPDEPPIVTFLNLAACTWVEDTKPTWITTTQYRLKPRMLTRTVAYPEPMRSVPAEDTEVWVVLASNKGPYQVGWDDYVFFDQMLENGMCFATEADAQTCYDALFGEQK